jgi:hypothetical protein
MTLKLSSELVDALRAQYEAMGFIFDPEALAEKVSQLSTWHVLHATFSLPII